LTEKCNDPSIQKETRSRVGNQQLLQRLQELEHKYSILEECLLHLQELEDSGEQEEL